MYAPLDPSTTSALPHPSIYTDPDPHSCNLVNHLCNLAHHPLDETKELPGVVKELQDNVEVHVIKMLPGVVEVIQDMGLQECIALGQVNCGTDQPNTRAQGNPGQTNHWTWFRNYIYW